MSEQMHIHREEEQNARDGGSEQEFVQSEPNVHAGSEGSTAQPLYGQKANEMRFRAVSGKRSLTLSVLYNLLALPLGIFYFSVLVTLLSVSVSTLVIWIGLPLFFCTIMSIWGLAAFERFLAQEMLGIPLPPMSRRRLTGAGWWQDFVARLKHPVTWKSLSYLLLKMPLGITSFTITVVFTLVSLAMSLAPVAYLVDTFLLRQFGYPAHTLMNIGTLSMTVDGTIRPGQIIICIAIAVLSILMWFLTRLVINGVASFSAWFVRLMLSEDGM